MKLSALSIFSAILLVTLFSVAAIAGDTNTWKPISPAELAMKEPVVDKNADAEAIFWEVWLDDKKSRKLSYDHYVRVKIFTERGRERFSKVDIPFYKGRKIEDVAARVIKPDGTVVDLNPSDIFEREIVKAGKIKILAKSFAIPAIEPGVIVEYRYSETLKNDSLDGETLIFQRDIPMQKVTYFVRPYKGWTPSFSYRNTPEMRFVENSDGFFVGSLSNVPALKEEPRMPPEDEVRYWVGLSYRTIGSLFNWSFWGMARSNFLREVAKPSKVTKQKVDELTRSAGSNDEKLRRLYEFSQRRLKNVSYDQAFDAEKIEKLKIKDVDDVLKLGMGSSSDINITFAALAKSAGFPVALVYSGDRSENFFDPNKDSSPLFLHFLGIGVLVDNKWTYLDPGTPFMPFGSVDWYEESVNAMVVEETSHSWRKLPLSPPEKSLAKRKGTFSLSEEGTLEGLARLEFNGHQAISRRRAGFRDTPAKRETDIKDELSELLKTAEISDITIENFEEPEKPLIYIFKVKVRNYAQKTGKRMFFQPGFFETGTNSTFTASERSHNIYFSYPWAENDEIEIKYPDSFSLDNADAPGNVADPDKISSLEISIYNSAADQKVFYKRKFFFGANNHVLFPATAYPALKKLFDLFHQANSHSVTLKQN